MRLALVAAWIAACAAPASAAGVAGTVVDAQGLPIAGASVALRCEGTAAATASTDSRGDFSLARADAAAACELSVDHDGFASLSMTVTPEAVALALRLELAAVVERVEVTAPRQTMTAWPIGATVVDGDELHRLGAGTFDAIRTAMLLAGVAGFPTTVYVDGVPAVITPPIHQVGRLMVNGNPFPAEYNDGDAAAVHILTRAPARAFSIRPVLSLPEIGGADLLRGGSSTSRAGGAHVSTPIPGIPVIASAQISMSRFARAIAVHPADPLNGSSPVRGEPLQAEGANKSVLVALSYASAAARRAQLQLSAVSSSSTNVGVGGLVLPSAGMSLRASTWALQGSTSGEHRGLVFESGVSARLAATRSLGNDRGPGIAIAGVAIGGGPAILAHDGRRLAWTAKQVVRSSTGRHWSAGLIASGVTHRQHEMPNPGGVFEFDGAIAFAAWKDGAPATAWRVFRPADPVAYRGAAVASFVDAQLMSRPRARIDGGVRVDHQRRVGTLVSPRIWAAGRVLGMTVQIGGGLFVQPIADHVFVSVRRHGVVESLTIARNASETLGQDVRTTLSPDVAMGRQLLQRVAVERSFGPVVPSVDYAWTRDWGRLGANRQMVDGTWFDQVTSDRAAARQRVSVRTRYQWRSQTFTFIYQWTRSRDMGDGPFSYPERDGELQREWAATAGIAPHAVTVTSALRLPLGISAIVADVWQSAAPLNVTTGFDDDQNGLFNERGGLARNSDWSPGQRSVSVYASRRFRWRRLWSSQSKPLGVSVGMRVDNLLNRRNYSSVGSVSQSATFMTPLAALPGRSAQLTLSVE